MMKLRYLFFALLLGVLSSCSDKDYIDAVPGNSVLVISMNPAKESGAGGQTMIKTLLKLSAVDQTGLDLSANLYFFEDGQGTFGLCSRVGNRSKLIETLKQKGLTVTQKRDFDFAVLPNHWVVGCSDKAALIMGPVLPANEEQLKSTMAGYLAANEEDGIGITPMFEKLGTIDAPMAMVCQTKALPEQFVAPLTLGAPEDADASDVLMAAAMEMKQGCLWVDGEAFSLKQNIDDSLKQAARDFRPIEGYYSGVMSKTDVVGMFMNVDGTKFIKTLHRNKGFKTMLTGINAAIDMDNIIKSIDGDMAIVSPSMGNDNFSMSMAARLKHANWLADVDYWKQSVPQGGHIGDWGRDCYYYSGDGTTYYFGVTEDWQYMSGSSKEAALQSIKPSGNPIDKSLQQSIKGQKMVMVINFAALKGSKAESLTAMLKPLFGDLNAIVYRLR